MATTIAPLQSEALSPLQVWIALQYLGVLSGAEAPPEDIETNPEAVTEAGADLVRRGLLVVGPGATVRASRTLESFLRPAAIPRCVVLAETQDALASGPARRQTAFGWTPDGLAVSWGAADGAVQFRLYPPDRWVDVLEQHLARPELTPETATHPSDRAVDAPALQRTVTLSASTHPSIEPPLQLALAWFFSEGQCQLLEAAGSNERPAPRPIALEELHTVLQRWTERLIAAAQPARGASS